MTAAASGLGVGTAAVFVAAGGAVIVDS